MLLSHLADDGGNVLERYTYGVWGEPIVYNGAGQYIGNSAYDNRFLFTGRDYMKETGLYDYRNRFYMPSLGRFLQSDPLGFGGGDANLFRYGGGDPVNNSDPSGLNVTLGGKPVIEGPSSDNNIPWAVPPSGVDNEATTGRYIVDPFDGNGSGAGGGNGNGGGGSGGQTGSGSEFRAGGPSSNWGAGQGAAAAAMVAWNDTPQPRGMYLLMDAGGGGAGAGTPRYSGNVTVNWWPQALTLPYTSPAAPGQIPPDFVNFNLSVGGIVSAAGSLTIDKFGNAYVSGGFVIGISNPISGSYTQNYLSGISNPSSLNSFLTRASITVGGGIGPFGRTMSVTPSGATATGSGLFSPEVGIGWQYGWYIGGGP